MKALLKFVKDVLGISKLQEEVIDLRRENLELKSLLNEHEQGIAYIAVIQSRMLKDMLQLVSSFNSTNEKKALRSKKPNDDFIN